MVLFQRDHFFVVVAQGRGRGNPVPMCGAKKPQDFLMAKGRFVIGYPDFKLQSRKELRKGFQNANGNLNGADGTVLC